ncbi:vitamin K epoxide reductase family protein [Candidatus Pacearchaeota archaeon]|nr:vitamin K epoxide reductase family protein [Candidatus Pacearchaeota archaeon]
MQQIIILILCAIGIAITSYIAIAHALKKKVICPVNSKSCNVVLDSKYSRTFGVKNEIIGLVYYIAVLYIIFTNQSGSILLVTKLISILASAVSIILIGIQTRVLNNYCSWCITTAIINVFISTLIITL